MTATFLFAACMAICKQDESNKSTSSPCDNCLRWVSRSQGQLMFFGLRQIHTETHFPLSLDLPPGSSDLATYHHLLKGEYSKAWIVSTKAAWVACCFFNPSVCMTWVFAIWSSTCRCAAGWLPVETASVHVHCLALSTNEQWIRTYTANPWICWTNRFRVALSAEVPSNQSSPALLKLGRCFCICTVCIFQYKISLGWTNLFQ